MTETRNSKLDLGEWKLLSMEPNHKSNLEIIIEEGKIWKVDPNHTPLVQGHKRSVCSLVLTLVLHKGQVGELRDLVFVRFSQVGGNYGTPSQGKPKSLGQA